MKTKDHRIEQCLKEQNPPFRALQFSLGILSFLIPTLLVWNSFSLPPRPCFINSITVTATLPDVPWLAMACNILDTYECYISACCTRLYGYNILNMYLLALYWVIINVLGDYRLLSIWQALASRRDVSSDPRGHAASSLDVLRAVVLFVWLCSSVKR